MQKPLTIGVAGGTASGKTAVARKIFEQISPDYLAYLDHDAYYRDLSHLPLEKRRTVNFDHPDSLENESCLSFILKPCSRARRCRCRCMILPSGTPPGDSGRRYSHLCG